MLPLPLPVPPGFTWTVRCCSLPIPVNSRHLPPPAQVLAQYLRHPVWVGGLLADLGGGLLMIAAVARAPVSTAQQLARHHSSRQYLCCSFPPAVGTLLQLLCVLQLA
jgi:hypothetical protein